MTTGRAGGAVMRPVHAPVYAPEGTALEAVQGGSVPPAILLSEKLRSYDPKADLDLISAAYSVAANAHGLQRRDNGDPYITHPIAVADILAGYRLDTASIATGLLHDVIEDTPVKLPEIQHRFGGE